MTPRERNLADIGLIALRHGLTRQDVLGRARGVAVSTARKQCYRMLRDRGLSYPQIGAIFNRHHTTIIEACPTRTDRPCSLSGASAGLV